MKYNIEEYVMASGRSPFAEWLLGLKDITAQAKLMGRIDRAVHGNFGDWKPLAEAKGVFEMRENYGPGYRIFYAIIANKIILLLDGSTKKDQIRTITRAKEYLADYGRRMNNETWQTV